MKKLVSVLLLFIFVFGVYADDTLTAKYIFLMVGDGMGSAHRTAAELYKNDTAESYNLKDSKIDKLVMNTFPVQSLCTTYSKNSSVTDSAAAGTAFATGNKVESGVISLDKNNKQPYKTIAEIAKDKGMKVGIVSSASIDDATPAVFYAHQASRNSYYDISMELGASNFDFFGGGQAKGAAPSGLGGRKSPVDFAIENGFNVTTNKKQFSTLKPSENKVWAYSQYVDYKGGLEYVIDRGDKDSLTLVDFTEKAIEILDNPNGFFIMVEGGKIDWAAHENDAATVVKEVLEFDDCVKVAYEFYKKHPDDTIVVVIADHETGGFIVDSNMDQTLVGLQSQKMSQTKFNEVVKSFRENKTEFKDAMPVIQNVFGLYNLSNYERELIEKAYAKSMDGEKEKSDRGNYGSYDPLGVTCCKIVDNRAGLSWTSFSHTGADVPVSVVGVGQESFSGKIDNTDIFKNINQLIK